MPSAGPRLLKRASGLGREFRLILRDVDSEELAPRVTALGFLLGGLSALSAKFLIPDLHAPASLGWITAVAALFGLVALLVPWAHYSRRAQLVLPFFGFALLACGGVLTRGAPQAFIAMLPLPFVFIGITQSPGTAVAVAPVAALALVIADRFRFDVRLDSTLLFALPMSCS